MRKILKVEEAAKELKLNEMSLRRWCVMLEWNGYAFQENENGIYELNEYDIKALKEIRRMLFGGEKLVNAVKKTVEKQAKVNEAVSKTTNEQKQTIPFGQLERKEIEKIINEYIEEKFSSRLDKDEEKIQQLQAIVNHLDVDVTELKVKSNKITKDIAEQQRAMEEYEHAMEQYELTHQEQRNKRDEELMLILREIMETKKMVAAAKENKLLKFWKFVTNFS